MVRGALTSRRSLSFTEKRRRRDIMKKSTFPSSTSVWNECAMQWAVLKIRRRPRETSVNQSYWNVAEASCGHLNQSENLLAGVIFNSVFNESSSVKMAAKTYIIHWISVLLGRLW